jgi:hypothetical protein
MSKKVRKRKKRVRLARVSGHHPSVQITDEQRGRMAARVFTLLGAAMLLAAIAASYVLPSLNRALGAHGNVALRIAGVALIIASMLFGRLGK